MEPAAARGGLEVLDDLLEELPGPRAAEAREGVVDLPHASAVRLLLLSHPQDIDVELTVFGFFPNCSFKASRRKKKGNECRTIMLKGH